MLIQQSSLPDEEKQLLLKEIAAADKQWTILEFKLDRTEKVKRTTAVLLEETIEELEKKRATEEEAKNALEKSLEELKAAQTQLIQAEKMASLGELTAGIAHEIQNPLNFVNNFSEVSSELLDDLKQEAETGNTAEVIAIAADLDENLKKIAHHGKRADAIVKGMLQHSRTSTGKKEATDINALAGEYLHLCYHGLRAKDRTCNADFKTDFDETIGKIEIVPQDMGRVLLNLFNNAFYAVQQRSRQETDSYRPLVEVSTRLNGNTVEIVVKDNGIGIPDVIKDKILQPFFTTKPTGEGTGLGLSLSYDIIAKTHSGRLNVESTEGEGSQFTIQLTR